MSLWLGRPNGSAATVWSDPLATGRGRAGLARHSIGMLGELAIADRERWPLWLPVGFGTGIACYFALPVEPAAGWGAALAGLAALAALAMRQRPAALLVAFLLMAVSLGFAAAQLRASLVAAPVIANSERPWRIEGRLADLRGDPQGRRLLLKDLRIEGLPPERTPAVVRVTWRGEASRQAGMALRIGERVRLRAVLRPPAGPAAPGAFDYARAAWFERLGGVGFALSAPETVPHLAEGEPGLADGFVEALARARESVERQVQAALPGPEGAVAVALFTGDAGGIAPAIIEAMRDSGLQHLLSISGLHMALVAGVVFFAVRLLLAAVEPLALAWPVKKLAAIAAFLAIFAYLLLTGGPVPTQRSFLMLAVALGAILVDRQPLSMRLVAWAALVVLLLQPESLLSASFQMSFAAVVALIACHEALGQRFMLWRSGAGWTGRGLLFVGGLALTSLVAGMATAPYAAFHFNRFGFYGLFANLIAVPLTSFVVMPAAVLAALLMPFGLAWPALWLMGQGVEGVLAVARFFAALPGAVGLVPAQPLGLLLLLTLSGLWLCLWRRRWRHGGWFGIAAALLLAALPGPPPPDVLIDAEGRLLAGRAADGRLLLPAGAGKGHVAESWLRRAGQDAPGFDARVLACDRDGCLYRRDGWSVLLAKERRAALEDCGSIDVLVGARGPRRCQPPRLAIDRDGLSRSGAQALWLRADAIHVETARQYRGERPWVLAADRTRQPPPRRSVAAQ